jgi:hypothetical protein
MRPAQFQFLLINSSLPMVYPKEILTKQRFVSDLSEQEMHQTNVYLYGFYYRFRLENFN